MIITFYSYKGGVGRSMAVANVAAWLAGQGLRVVVVDWDLEAPGIEAYFESDATRISDIRRSHGLMDSLVAYRELQPSLDQIAPLHADDESTSGTNPDLDAHVADEAARSAEIAARRAEALRAVLPTLGPALQGVRGAPRASRRRNTPGIWILSAGAREGELFGSYAQNVQSFDWATFYAEREGAAFFDWLRGELESYCDVTLIDSRTGVTEMSGVSTRGLADLVVSMCAANISNLDGVLRMSRWFLERSVMTLRGRPLSAMIIPSRIDGRVETTEVLRFKDRFIEGIRSLRDLDPDVTPDLWWDLQIGYVGLYSFHERIVAGQAGESEYLQRDYDKLGRHLALRLLAQSPEVRVELSRRPIGSVLRQLLSDSGVAPALQADAVLTALDGEQQARALSVLTRFVKLAREEEGGAATVVQVPASKFAQHDRPLIDRLVASGLLTSDESASGPTFRLSQPELVTAWKRFASSIEADRSFLEWRQQMADSLADWDRHRSDTYLLAGRPLAEAAKWTKNRQDDLVPEELKFIERSERVTLQERAGARPRRLVVAGTLRNRSPRSFLSNVERLFSAVDLTDGAQLASVTATEGRPFTFASLASAFGWGLKRDVLSQYRFLCTHFRPGDQIFVFGSGRGAFRVRALADLIADQGLIVNARGGDLIRLSHWAYREYRRRFSSLGPVFATARLVRNVLLWILEARRPRYDAARNVAVDIAFMGLWDTLPGYGLPFQQLTAAWDRWIWPLSTCDDRIPSNVQKVCHALALDEDRQALDPLLIDESHERIASHVDEERVTQVWFAGTHENVSGGTADDSLAHVSLEWMAMEAGKKGLTLLPHVSSDWTLRANPLGEYTSARAGLRSYYRYRPRSLQRLGYDGLAGATTKRSKAHESIFQRIVALQGDYAPIALPEDYGVVTRDGKVLDRHDNPYEHPTQSIERCAEQELAWNLVWLRRATHGLALAVAIIILILPVFVFSGAAFLGPRSLWFAGLIDILGSELPSSISPWVTAYGQYPFALIVLGAMLLGLVRLSRALGRSIHERMRRTWEAIVKHGSRPVTPSHRPLTFIFRFRTHPVYRTTANVVSARILPFALGLAIVVTMLGTVNRATFGVASRTCTPATNLLSSQNGTWPEIQFDNRSLCQTAGIELRAGRTYEISIRLPQGWKDKNIPADLTGISPSTAPFVYIAALPFRRVIRAPWFVPVARIGVWPPEYHMLTQAVTQITPRHTGQLFLFVNDAVGPPGLRSYFYDNNEPGPTEPARIIVREITPTAASPAQ